MNPHERPYDPAVAKFIDTVHREIGVDENRYATLDRLLTEVEEDLGRPTYVEDKAALENVLLAKLDVAEEIAKTAEERARIAAVRQHVEKGSGTAPVEKPH